MGQCRTVTYVAIVQALIVKCGALRTTSRYIIDRSKSCLSSKDVVAGYWEARKLGLRGFEAECAAFIGVHAKTVAAVMAWDDPLCKVLKEVIRNDQLKPELRTIRRYIADNQISSAYRAIDALLI